MGFFLASIRKAEMPAKGAAAAATTAKQPRSPISRRQIETVVSRSVAIISLVFAVFYQRYVMRRDLEGASTVLRDQR